MPPWSALLISGTAVLTACVTVPPTTAPMTAGAPVQVTTAHSPPAQPSAIAADQDAVSVQRPAVDLRPPPPVPFLTLRRDMGGNGPDPSYSVELNPDGSGRFTGRYFVCVKGEVPFQVSSATVEEAKRLVRESHVFDYPLPPCSRCCLTDVPPVAIYFWQPPLVRTVGDSDCPQERRPIWKLAHALDELLDVKQWVGTIDSYGRCKR